MKALDRIMRIGEGRAMRRLEGLAERVSDLEPRFRELDDAALRSCTSEFRQRLAAGESLDDLLPEAFAVVREASVRVLGQRPYDVQIMGGAALHLGNIAEMQTGEGKTLSSALPAYLNALAGQGVHIVTVNQYLARRDAEWMGRIHEFLGLTIGVLLPDATIEQRKAAYRADITYGTNNEFGFDYLRDHMAMERDHQVQRGLYYAIVDEVDSILIDEARTPLVIARPIPDSSAWHSEFASIVAGMIRGIDYEVDEKARGIGITDSGITRVEESLGIDNLYHDLNSPLLAFLQNAMSARELYVRDRDYILTPSGEVIIVDPHTGRTMPGRRFGDGLHQAIEAKEGVPILGETQVLATITLQNFFRMYDKLSGMTGTADTEAAEFQQIYGLGVIPIPTNRPIVRIDHPDLVYRTALARDHSVLEDVRKRHAKGQPVLIGTTSVEASEHLSSLLTEAGIPHAVLNAKQNATEAGVVASAGRLGSVTVATNMAGRGTDILLGGDPTLLAEQDMEAAGLDRTADPESWAQAWPAALAAAQEEARTEAELVRGAGGLYVLGTERHDARRIDNQLRGRAGRQGDRGESRFCLSLEDRLMRLFKTDALDAFLRKANVPDAVPIDFKSVGTAIRSAQAQQEGLNFEARKKVLTYDEVMNRQRLVVYAERDSILQADEETLAGFASDCIRRAVQGIVQSATASGYSEDWDIEDLRRQMADMFPTAAAIGQLRDGSASIAEATPEQLTSLFTEEAAEFYASKEAVFSFTGMRQLERQILLYCLDTRWRDHLYEMEYLRNGIGLRSYGTRSPEVEYATEGAALFQDMMSAVAEDSARLLLSLTVAEDAPREELAAGDLVYVAPLEPGAESETPHAQEGGPGGAQERAQHGGAPVDGLLPDTAPNTACPCGSGRKFKRCHGQRALVS